MENEIIEKIALNVLESMFKAGLKSIRKQQEALGQNVNKRPLRAKKSNTKIVEEILRETGHSLHIDEIIRRAKDTKTVELHRESIVSALTKKLLEHKIFVRTGRNEFALREWREK